MAEISKKQLEANKKNAKLGGVKTQEGKDISKYNAVRHNILTNLLTHQELDQATTMFEHLKIDLKPIGMVEEILTERVAIWYVRMQRAMLAETELFKEWHNPRRTETTGGYEYVEIYPPSVTTVINEGYKAKINNYTVETLTTTYYRYESILERNFLKALHELQRVQAARKGDTVLAPIAIDLSIENKKEENMD